MEQDPCRLPVSTFQWAIVAIMVGLNALDGFDVLSISFASPGILAAWRVDAQLGLMLSMELTGMSLGFLALGSLTDAPRRRVTILDCLVAMACGMFGAASTSSVVTLSLWRVITGIGIGEMLAAPDGTAISREISLCTRRRWRLPISTLDENALPEHAPLRV